VRIGREASEIGEELAAEQGNWEEEDEHERSS